MSESLTLELCELREECCQKDRKIVDQQIEIARLNKLLLNVKSGTLVEDTKAVRKKINERHRQLSEELGVDDVNKYMIDTETYELTREV